jgi:regulator of replication initiation timing
MSTCLITENARLREENERLKSGGAQQTTANEWDEYLSQIRSEKEKLHDEIQVLSAREQVAIYHFERERDKSTELLRQVTELTVELHELRAELAAWRASTRKNPESDAVRLAGWGQGKDE